MKTKTLIIVIIVYLVFSTMNLIRCWLDFTNIDTFNKILMAISFTINCCLVIMLIKLYKKHKTKKITVSDHGDKQ